MKLNYSFSKREIILILALVLVLVGLLYYRFVYLRISSEVDQYDTADLEAQIQMDQLQLIEWEKMQNEIDTIGKVSTSSLETYDNQKNEINLLNDIFEPVIRYNFSFEKPVATGDTVRRNVSVSFTTIDYPSALDIITKLHNSKYRVLIRDINISPGDLTADYLSALATEALNDQVALNQLIKQVDSLLAANLEVDPYVMKVYRGEPLTEAPETELLTESVPVEGEMPQETVLEDGTIIEGGETGEPAPEDTQTAETIPEGGTVETLADGTVVAPHVPVTETQSETQTETEKPVQTLQNCIINVSMTMTFYETAYNAPSLDGLIIVKPEAPAAEEVAG